MKPYQYQVIKKDKSEGEYERLYKELLETHEEVRLAYINLVEEYNHLVDMYEALNEQESPHYCIVVEVLSSYGTLGKKIKSEIDSKI